MNTLQSAWQQPASGATQARRRQNTPWWLLMAAARHAQIGLALLAVLGVAGLLLAFQQVVLQGVQQGESRNRATAAHAEGVWRCSAMHSVSQRAGCRVQLDAAHAAATSGFPRGDTAAVALVLSEQ